MTISENVARAQAIAAEAAPRVRERRARLADNDIVRDFLAEEQRQIGIRAVKGYHQRYVLAGHLHAVRKIAEAA